MSIKAKAFTPKEKKIITSIICKIADLKKFKVDLVLINFKELFLTFSQAEIEIAKKILEINPNDYGFHGSFYGFWENRSFLVKLLNQKYEFSGKTFQIPTQFLPRNVYFSFTLLKKSLKAELDKNIFVGSGYRSSAYQLLTFIHHLKLNNFDLGKNLKMVALPGYSEHGYLKKQAIDFVTDEGIPSSLEGQEFAKTIEFDWLSKNAKRFGFALSYPKDNDIGVMFEPWHWSFMSS